MGGGGPRAGLARALPDRAGAARLAAGGRGPRRHPAPRRPGDRLHAEPPAAHGLVRAAPAAPALRAKGTMLRLCGRAGLSLALLLVFAFGVGAPPEHCSSVSSAELRQSSQAAVDWLVRNQNPYGSWLYDYNADTDSAKPEYNPVRHSGVALSLYQAAAAGFPRAMRSADLGTEWALRRLLERDGWAAVAAQPEVDTGATALLVAGLATRRETTDDKRYDRVLRRLGRFLVAQTEPSGAVLAEYDPARGPVPGKYSKYFTGETYMALARLHRIFPGEEWGRVADRIGAYLASSRDDKEDHFPPIPDHWAAYGMAETVDFPDRG